MEKIEKAIFAAGCFWGVEATLRRQFKTLETRVGYTGGKTQNPDYRSVCQGNTGHAEAIEICFNPRAVAYTDLLAVFWLLHDPTQLNRQGPDVGTQYRSAIFYLNESQRAAAEASKTAEQQQRNNPIVTVIEPASEFWPAEEYHQCYLQKQKGGAFF